MDVRSSTRTVVVCVAAVLVAAAAPAGPAAPAVACGDVITTSVTLDADLVCDDARGLRITAPVTLDLGGHALVAPDDGRAPRGYGITIDTPGPVTVRNGSLAGWDYTVLRLAPAGWSAPERDRMTFEDLRVSGSTRGIVPLASATVVRRSTFRDNQRAIECDGVCSLDLDEVVATGNDRVVDGRGGQVTVTDSTFRDNFVAISTYGLGARIERTTFFDNFRAVAVGGGEGTVRANVFRRNDYGVTLRGSSSNATQHVVENLFVENCWGVVTPDIAADVSRNVLLDHGATAIVTPRAAVVDGNVISGQRGDESCRRRPPR